MATRPASAGQSICDSDQHPTLDVLKPHTSSPLFGCRHSLRLMGQGDKLRLSTNMPHLFDPRHSKKRRAIMCNDHPQIISNAMVQIFTPGNLKLLPFPQQADLFNYPLPLWQTLALLFTPSGAWSHNWLLHPLSLTHGGVFYVKVLWGVHN